MSSTPSSRPSTGASASAYSRVASTAPPTSSTAGRGGGGVAGAGTGAPRDLSSLLGVPLRITLADSMAQDARKVEGRLFAFDPLLGCVALETTGAVPKNGSEGAGGGAEANSAGNGNGNGSGSGVRAVKGTRAGFRIVKIRQIKAVEVVGPLPSPAPSGVTNGTTSMTSSEAAAQALQGLIPVAPVSIQAAEEREAKAIKAEASRIARIGVGVTEEAQEVYDALAKTLPVRWHEKHIIVLDEVIISPPYEVSNVKVPNLDNDHLAALCDGKAKERQPGAKGKANSWARVRKVLEGERKRLAAR